MTLMEGAQGAGRSGMVAGILWLGAGALLLLAGGGVTAVGTGAPGLETQTFTRVSCHETRTAKGGTVRHCFGMTRAQIKAATEDERRARLDALRAHRSGGAPWVPAPTPRTRLSFVDHDGRQDPVEVTATLVGSYWIAHAPSVVAAGGALLLAGAGVTAAGVARLRTSERAGGDGAAPCRCRA
ncbi:hypothetical protein ACIBG7_42675 [Nonomuraea sp. NPDC050328]|uniref:hypothetical protein n=1 Tax=Nonomuraea sp. NPDC050328 TaxID=3364361 RepID=UPI0037B1662C